MPRGKGAWFACALLLVAVIVGWQLTRTDKPSPSTTPALLEASSSPASDTWPVEPAASRQVIRPLALDQASVEGRLRGGATLTIRVSTSAGVPMPEPLRVRLESRVNPFLVLTEEPSWREFGNPKPEGYAFLKETAVFVFREATMRLGAIRPGMPISISARSNLMEEPVTREVELAPGESRILDLVLPGEFGRLSGRVVSIGGTPVADARVTAAVPGAKRDAENPMPSRSVNGWWSNGLGEFGRGNTSLPTTVASLLTDTNGAFDFGAVPARVYELSVESADHATWVSKDHRVTSGATPLTITMDSGVSVEARFLDGERKPLPDAAVSVAGFSGKTDAEGRVRFQHLPRGLVSFDTFFGGVRTSFPHDTSNPVPTFQIQVINR